MGYTHYWTMNNKSDVKAEQKLVKFVIKLVELSDVELSDGSGESCYGPYIRPHRIEFNGIEECSYESFVLRVGDGADDFCKTIRKPYDKCVVACLVYAEKLGIVLSWKSDGGDADHVQGRLLCQEVEAAMED